MLNEDIPKETEPADKPDKPLLLGLQPAYEYKVIPKEELHPQIQITINSAIALRNSGRVATGWYGLNLAMINNVVTLPQNIYSICGMLSTALAIYPHLKNYQENTKTPELLAYNRLGQNYYSLLGIFLGVTTRIVPLLGAVMSYRHSIRRTKMLGQLIDDILLKEQSPFGNSVGSAEYLKYNRLQIDERGSVVLEVDPRNILGHEKAGFKKMIARISYFQPLKRVRVALNSPRMAEKKTASAPQGAISHNS